MKNTKTQSERVLDRIKEVGYVDNLWAFNNAIWRLSEVIRDLEDKGYEFPNRGYKEGTKVMHYYPSNIKEVEEKILDEKVEKLKRWSDGVRELMGKAFAYGGQPTQKYIDLINEINKTIGRPQYKLVEEVVDNVSKTKIVKI